MAGIIYHAFDTTNGKAWVGQTQGTLEERQKEHLSQHSKCTVFRNALLKRPDAFVWTVLTSGLTEQSDLDDAEIYWGLFLDTLVPNGYNLKLGRGRTVWSEEEKERHSILMTVVHNRPELKKRRNQSVKASWERPDVRERHVKAFRAAGKRPEVRRHHSEAAKIVQSRPEVQLKHRMTNSDPEVKRRRSIAQKARRERERRKRAKP